uniref:DUF6570 domain-containing protein n=1 Tax=Romanomermis culicivorax TaxID=13658 RepID=A0A915HSW6_ROMCU
MDGFCAKEDKSVKDQALKAVIRQDCLVGDVDLENETIIKLKPLSKRKGPKDYVEALKGLALHLPLPLKATHEYLKCKLPSADALSILVDSCPTKKNVVWRSAVNLDKVYAALRKLKEINPMYADIEINTDFANTAENEIPVSVLEGTTVQHTVTEQEFESMLKKGIKCEPYTHITVETMKDDVDPNLMDVEIYRTMKIQSTPLNFDNDKLDLMCFPELYPTGYNGLYSSRPRKFVRRMSYEKWRLCRNETKSKSYNDGRCSTRQNAMDLKFGPATWFLTLSAAEYAWPDMEEYLQHQMRMKSRQTNA